MSTTITYQFQTNLVIADGIRDTFVAESDTIDQTVDRVYRNVQEVGTTEELLSMGAVVTPGLCVFQNLDATNYVEIGVMASGGLPANSELRIAADGTPHLQNVTNSFWYPFQVNGTDGNVYMEQGQDGVSLPAPSVTTFAPFMKLKPGEKALLRVGVTAIYARANSANIDLFYIIYAD